MLGKSQSNIRPTALGTLMQAATYGATIPTIYGTTQSNLLAIWAANLRKGYSTKKNKKKGVQTYLENIDLLIGSNPIAGVLQLWNNGARYGLNFLEINTTYASLTQTASLIYKYTITDTKFYFLLAVTLEIVNKGAFFDYGSNGPSAYNNTSEFPLYNIWQNGPSLNESNASRRFPMIYKWAPSDGMVVYFPSLDREYTSFPSGAYGIPGWNGNIHLYYAQLQPRAGSPLKSPLALNALAFEAILGSGTEYSGFTSQQLTYPEYAGAGSGSLDCGAGPAIPDLQLEVSGSFARFAPRGDADFCDMIEDTMKSGVIQVGSQIGVIQRGLNLSELPATVDKMQAAIETGNGESDAQWIGFQQPVVTGQVMFCFVNWEANTSGVNVTITDDAASTWVPIFISDLYGFWYAIAGANIAAGNNIHAKINGAPTTSLHYRGFGWVSDPQSNAVAATSVATGTTVAGVSQLLSCSIVVPTAPAYIVVAVRAGDDGFIGIGNHTPPPIPQHWNNLFPQDFAESVSQAGFTSQIPQNDRGCVAYRIVNAPGTYTFNIPLTNPNPGFPWAIGMVALASMTSSAYPKALGNIIDNPSLDLVRKQCQANGLWGSVTMNAQKAASEWLKDFYMCANAWPLWSGFVLKSIARSEVSVAGNGVVFTSPTSAGPVATLTQADLIGDASKPLVTVERTAQVDAPNIMQAQFFDRNSDYNPSLVAEPVSGAITLFSPRKQDPILLPEVQDPSVARPILAIEVRRFVLLRNSYSFVLKQKWAPLEATDLVLINEPLLNIVNLPVRLTAVNENDSYELECTAEPFYYGCNSPTPPANVASPFATGSLAVTPANPYQPPTGSVPLSVNTPLIFEAVPRLYGQGAQGQVWAVVSSPDPNYGGCIVMLSTDGGNSYNQVGQIAGNGVTGYLTADWPAATDPDTTNDLLLNLSESLGTLPSHSVTDEDNFVYPCIVTPGLTCIPYELMTYGVAVLTGANLYTLKATGSVPNHLRRAVFSAPQFGTGVDHPYLSRFAYLNPSGQGIFKINMDPLWIGKTIYFKFLAVNSFGLQQQDVAAATAYSFTPTGCPSGEQNPNTNSYSLTGGALTNPNSTTIDMAQATAQFPSNVATYNARVFTIPAPTVPTTYYVTIADPAQLGDEGTSTNLVATAQTSDALVGIPGNTYIGSIVVLPGGGGTVTGTGGSIPGGGDPAEILVNGI